jgi:hypothetical protein
VRGAGDRESGTRGDEAVHRRFRARETA